MNQRIVDQAAVAPAEPGVYVFSDAAGRALYVGKAANLRARVRAYLKPGGDGRPMLRFLEREAADLEYVVVATEQEALLLEDTVVKKLKPIYNVKLKDDKAFLLLRLDQSEPWPWFTLVRRRRSDGAEYFGPYASATSVRRTLRLLHKVTALRDCKDGVFKNRSRPCIKHEIGRCPAPCVGLVTRERYDQNLDSAAAILRGRAGPLLRRLRTEMDAAAQSLEFERAHALKSQIGALMAVSERQSVVGAGTGDQDAFAIDRADGGDTVAAVLMFRGGRLESSRKFRFRSAVPDALLLGDVLARFYQGERFIPAEVLVPVEVPDRELLADWLSEKRGASVDIAVPQRGQRRRHLELALENARLRDVTSDVSRDGAAALAAKLGLVDAPQRIHCLDVSTIQGTATVASRVCFVDGRPHKDGYRHFRISAKAAGDDFAAMDEAVRRSLRLCLTRDDDDLPDVLVVDGGKGQLSSACAAAADLGLGDDFAMVGLAKSRLRGLGDQRRASDERLFLPRRGEPIALPPRAPVTLFLAAIRDEAHRFAITYHRKVRGRLSSELDDIPGIGPARRRLLLRHFGSLGALRRADLDALRAVPGLPAGVAAAVFESLQESGESR